MKIAAVIGLASRVGCVLAAMLVTSCGSSASSSQDPPSPSPSPSPSAEEAPGAAVYLRSHAEPARALLVVDVLARGVADVRGAAFRLRYDPAKLAFRAATPGEVWSSKALLLAKEGTPGELVVVWTEKGSSAGFEGREETRLGTIELSASDTSEPPSFRAGRSKLVDSQGADVDVAWLDAP